MSGLRFGVRRAYFFDLLDAQVAARFDEACDRMRRAGAIPSQLPCRPTS